MQPRTRWGCVASGAGWECRAPFDPPPVTVVARIFRCSGRGGCIEHIGVSAERLRQIEAIAEEDGDRTTGYEVSGWFFAPVDGKLLALCPRHAPPPGATELLGTFGPSGIT
jgi:hypothetical protein